MQRRLDEYEKQGVEATLQMQQAARTVAMENARLRLLLARRGVHSAEVDKFLGMFDTGAAAAAREDEDDILHGSGGILSGFPPALAPPQHTNTAPTTTSTYQHHNQHHHSDATGIDRLAVLADASIGDRCCGSTSSSTAPSESTVAAASPPSAGPSTMPGTPVSGPHSQYHSHRHHHHHSHATPQPPAGSASPLVMSCNTAAQIIAEMQGGAPVNRHAVKASLGCEDAECECFVKNTLLFQIMEKNVS